MRALGGAVDAEDILGVDGDARAALDDEIRRSEHDARPWQAVAAATNAAVDLIWHLLPDAERARFQSQWRALWMARRANFPMRNARKLQALFRAGQLEVLSGYVDSRHDAAGGFVTRLRTPAGERELRSRYLINATSFSVDAAGAADPLVSALLRDGHGQAHPHGGLALDYATGSLLDAGGVVQPAITLLGSLAGGTYFWTTSMDVNARLARDQARRIAALADAGATVPGAAAIPHALGYRLRTGRHVRRQLLHPGRAEAVQRPGDAHGRHGLVQAVEQRHGQPATPSRHSPRLMA